jgi:hypothetical protein
MSFSNGLDSNSYTTIIEIDSQIVISSSLFDSGDYKIKINLTPKLSSQLTHLLLESKELFVNSGRHMEYANHTKLIGCKIPYFKYNYLGLANEINCDLYFILKTFFFNIRNQHEAINLIWEDFFVVANK